MTVDPARGVETAAESSGYRKCAGMAKHLRAAEVENCECGAWADARSDTVRDILA